MSRARLPLVGALAAVSLALAGCAGTAAAASSPSPGSTDSNGRALSGTVTVLAAASLSNTFTTLGARFEKEHPGVTVQESFGGSATLAQQIVQGAPADVFASAADAPMTTVTRAGLASGPTEFATNVLELVVPKSNPARITKLADLARPGVKTILCDPSQPCGAAARSLLAATGVEATPVSLEQDVSSVLTKVELDEADAGLVYATDARSAGDKVRAIPVPEAAQIVNDYPIVVLTHAPNPRAARAFLRYVLGPVGTKALRDAGFGTAPAR